MGTKKLKILVLFDIPYKPPQDNNFKEIMRGADEWKTERDVMAALQRIGHEVSAFGIYNDIRPLLWELETNRPDIVFNLCEAVDGDRDQEPNLVGMLQMLKIPFTGAGPGPLRICKDKGLTKRILGFHRIRVPRFEVSHRSRPLKSLKGIKFPVITTPLGFEGSEGISQISLAKTEEDCLERINYVHEKLESDAIIEEFIDGREIYVGIIGRDRLTVLPTRELFFHQAPEGMHKFATFKAKWDNSYREKWGIDTDKASPMEATVERRLSDMCKRIYRLFEIDGYARIDLRISNTNEIVFIEANPNPSIAKDDDFALSAKEAGMTYDDLIGKIVNMAVPA